MSTHSKISPLLPHTITLSSPYNHQDFLRRSPKFVLNLFLNSILEDHPRQYNPKVKEQKNLFKILRSLKCIKKIHQNDPAFHRMRLPTSKIKDLVKKVQRVETLGLQDRLTFTSTKLSPVRLDLWLKYGKGLKSVNYHFLIRTFGIQMSIHWFERQILQSLKFLPNHRRLSTFNIRLPYSSPKTVESLFEFQRYPASLKDFAIYQQCASDPRQLNTDVMASAFSRLKSLESLTLAVGASLFNMTEILLEKTPSLLNVKKFNVQQSEIHSTGPRFDLNKCQTFQNLRHLKIGNIVESVDLSKLKIPLPQLESLHIAASLGENGPGLISQFISLFSNSLKSLKIDIHEAYNTRTEEKFKTFFKRISELERLTSFKFRVRNTAPSFALNKVNLSPELIENLKGLFLKPVKLESFEWEVPRISGPGILLDLLKLLEGSIGTLRKLKILHPLIVLEKSQETWLLNFLRRLERIKVLYLTDFGITKEKFWVDLVDCFVGMKSLRSLEIGIIIEGFQEEWFTQPLMKITQIKGLEVLEVGSLFKPEREEVVKKPLYLKEIAKVNPALKKVSNNIRALFNTIGLEE